MTNTNDQPLSKLLAELRSLHEAATPGPWSVFQWTAQKSREDEWNIAADAIEVVPVRDVFRSDADSIAALHNAAPRLLDELEKLERVRDVLAQSKDTDLLVAEVLAILEGDTDAD